MMKLPSNVYIAHISDDGRIHNLEDHLRETAAQAASFATRFNAGEWGRLAGLWHDIGKYSPEFQKMIRAANGIDGHVETVPGRVDHSTAAGLWAIEHLEAKGFPIGRLLAYSLCGHHAGLADWCADQTGRKALSERLKSTNLLNSIRDLIPPDILQQQIPQKLPKGYDLALWIRMIFSCLVDADFLDTERFFSPETSASRSRYPQIADLLPVFTGFMEAKQASAPDTPVNRIRSDILQQCIAIADTDSGAFSLTVPTGGGKTLSSLAFALHHAHRHNKQRIIYVIPYTSIIEQTADQFREIFPDAVLEHHSNLDVTDVSKENAKTRLACENWDAPIIVTTSVQFFESLFAARTSRCRKLHNIVDSVVIFDEAQLLPPEFLNPIMYALRELKANYGVSLLLCTATQPALGPQPSFGFEGIPGITEIMDDPSGLAESLKRVDLHLPVDFNEQTGWNELAAELTAHPSVLCIVNRRDDASTLWEMMPEGTYHLSARMCGQHRSAVIKEIKDRLRKGLPTRVISTQLVEAGVDLDFPVVYRAMAGLDSIAQAAGRCNREGRLQQRGTVRIFVPTSQPPKGVLRQAVGVARVLLSEEVVDHMAPERFTRFFRDFYWLQGHLLDKKKILDDLCPKAECEIRYSFRSAAEKFQLIDEASQVSIVVLYGESPGLIKQVEQHGPNRFVMRQLQRYIINIPRYQLQPLLETGAIRDIQGMLVQDHQALYDRAIGFCQNRTGLNQPDDLV